MNKARWLRASLILVVSLTTALLAAGRSQKSPKAPCPPGKQATESPRIVIPKSERQALISLYQATGGPHWKERANWLGPAGTECYWYGVQCDQSHVFGVVLPENNLTGAIPESLVDLTQLNYLVLVGNRLRGRLPKTIIEHAMSGSLDVVAEANLLTDISEIDFESSSTSILCASHRVILRSDGRATLFTEKCRRATSEDRETYCEVKEGTSYQFEALARLLDKNGFFGFKREYSKNITDAGLDKIRVQKGRVASEVVDYAGGAPFELWVIKMAIEGVAAQIEWNEPKQQTTCPKW